MTKISALSTLLFLSASTEAFQLPLQRIPIKGSEFSTNRATTSSALYMAESVTEEDLKRELTRYLKIRDDSDADEAARKELGKIVGGTKGNAVLEFISGAPNKEFVLDELPDVFDYSELGKYGFSNLVTPIMDAGGRLAMYELMDMPVPATKDRIKKVKKVPKLVIDRTGETDENRYSGLKVTQVIDDDEMGRKLAEALQKTKEGKDLKSKLIEEEYVLPFADKRNTGPMQTPDWTPERLDEEGIRAGQSLAWARRAREGEFKSDPFELLSIEGGQQAYSVLTTVFTAFVFGSSTKKLFEILNFDDNGLLDLAQGPALAIVLASIGSCILCGLEAPSKNRNGFVWGVKGYAGGPLAVLQLKGLNALVTRGEADQIVRDAKE